MFKRTISLIISFVLLTSLMTFSYADNTVYTFQAESYSQSQKITSTTTGNITYVSVSETGYTSFDLSNADAGIYQLNLRASGESSSVNLSLDSVPLLQMYTRKTNALKTFDDNFAYVELKEGANTLKISATANVLNFDYVTLTKLENVTKETKDNFLSEINNSNTAEKYEKTIYKYAEQFNINISTLTQRIFYKLPIWEELSNRNYDDLNDAIKDFYDSVKKYQSTQNQPVLAYNVRTPITALQSGDLSFYVKTQKLSLNTTIICAIYKNGALYKMNYGTYTSGNQVIIPINAVEIENGNEYKFKTLYIENFSSIKSVNLYDKIYENIYVSAEGNDAYDGTKEKPVKTLKRAKELIATVNTSMTGDIIVNIGPGEYFIDETEKITSSHGGKNGYNVVFSGTDKENPPIIHGGIKVTGWEQYKDGIYVAPLDGVSDVRNLYVDGYSALRARSENTFRLEEFYDDADTEYKKDGYKVLKKRMPYSFSRPQDLEMVWHLGWCAQRVPVCDVFQDGDLVVFESDAKNAVNREVSTETININTQKYFFLENAMELLDKPGEFYFNPAEKKIYYYKSEGETLENVYVPVTEGLFEIGDKSESSKTENIIFDNLDIRYGAYCAPSGKGFMSIQADQLIDLDKPSGTKMMHSQVTVNNASNIKITNCRFSCLGSNALNLVDGVNDALIEGNVIRDISGTGISIGTWEHTIGADGVTMCRNIDVKNNVIRRAAQDYRGCTGIAVYYENSINILNNDIADLPYTGITAGWGWGANVYTAGNMNISNNKVSDVMNTLLDGSNIYTLGPLKDSVISNNYLSDSKYVISGIYTDSGSALLKIFDNVIDDKDKDGYWWYQGHNNTKNLHAFNNYTTVDKVRVATESNNVEENTHKETFGALSDEALKIKNNAGLKAQYLHLLNDVNLPQNKVNIAKTTPKYPYASGAFRYASEYDRCFDPTTGEVSVPSHEYVSFNKNEWVEFDIEIKEAGTYKLSMAASNGWADKVSSSVSVSVDGNEAFAGTIPATEGWTPYVEFELGELELKEGINKVRIKNVNKHSYGFHFSSIFIEK